MTVKVCVQWNFVLGWKDFHLERGQEIEIHKSSTALKRSVIDNWGLNKCKIHALDNEDLFKTDTGSNAKMNVNHFRRNVSNYATVVEDAICKALIAALIQVLHENEYFRCSTTNRSIY